MSIRDASTQGGTGRGPRWAAAFGLALALVLLAAAPGWAASPSSSSVGPSHTSAGWKGKTFVAGATASPSLCGSSDTLCDHVSFTVAATSSYWSTHTGSVRVAIAWGASSNNFDLYVYRGGSLVGSSASGSSTNESVTVTKPSGTYSVVVVPKLVANSGYRGSVSFSSQTTAPPASPSPSPSHSGGGGLPTPLPTGLPTGGGGSSPGGGSGGSTGGSGGPTGGSGAPNPGSGGQSVPPQPGQPGAPTVFPAPTAPIFNYQGPYHFKPPFTVGGPAGGPVLPPQDAGGGVVVPGGSSLGGGHAVLPPGSSNGDSSSTGSQPVRIRSASAADPGGSHAPGLIWLLAPLGLVIVVAIGVVVFEPDERPASHTAAASEQAVDAPPAGPFVALGFAVRKLVRRVRRS